MMQPIGVFELRRADYHQTKIFTLKGVIDLLRYYVVSGESDSIAPSNRKYVCIRKCGI